MRSATAAAWASARRSIQIIAGRTGRPAASQATMPSSCDPKERPAIAAAPPGQSSISLRHARSTPVDHASGSCSAHPGCGKDRSYGSYADPTSVPSAS